MGGTRRHGIRCHGKRLSWKGTEELMRHGSVMERRHGSDDGSVMERMSWKRVSWKRHHGSDVSWVEKTLYKSEYISVFVIVVTRHCSGNER